MFGLGDQALNGFTLKVRQDCVRLETSSTPSYLCLEQNLGLGASQGTLRPPGCLASELRHERTSRLYPPPQKAGSGRCAMIESNEVSGWEMGLESL